MGSPAAPARALYLPAALGFEKAGIAAAPDPGTNAAPGSRAELWGFAANGPALAAWSLGLV